MRVCLVSLGCPKNRVDGETMLGLLGMAGHEIAASPALADAVLVNTCAFIRPAQRESVETILKLAAMKRAGRVRLLAVTGCLAQRYGRELMDEVPEIDLVLGTGAVGQIVEALERAAAGDRPCLVPEAGYLPPGVVPRLVTTPPWTAYLKVSEGCSNRCAYCVIPDLRGPHRSRPPGDLLDEAEQLVAGGAKEVILVGQDLTRYGEDLGGRNGLPALLERLTGVRGLSWLRLHYLHPAHLDEAMLRAMADSPVTCRYLDLPMQHGDDAILAAMGRGVTAATTASLVERARALMPDLTVRTSFIVGFPGESEASFRRLLAMMRRVEPDYTGVFCYSREGGTRSDLMPGHLPSRVKAARRARAMMLGRAISHRRNLARVGSTLKVLVEASHPSPTALPDGSTRPAIRCRHQGQAPEIDGLVYLVPTGPAGGAAAGTADGAAQPRPGEFHLARVVSAGHYDLGAELETRAPSGADAPRS